MTTRWYEVRYQSGDRMVTYSCQLEGTLERSVLSKKEDDFIKLVNVRWIATVKKNKRPVVVKLTDYYAGNYYDGVIFVRKSAINQIFPISPTSPYYRK